MLTLRPVHSSVTILGRAIVTRVVAVSIIRILQSLAPWWERNFTSLGPLIRVCYVFSDFLNRLCLSVFIFTPAAWHSQCTLDNDYVRRVPQ